jgi:hypothetical protein
MTMKERDGGWWGNQQRSDKKDSREIRKKKRKICKKEITTKKKFGSLNERKICFYEKIKNFIHTTAPWLSKLYSFHTQKNTRAPVTR